MTGETSSPALLPDDVERAVLVGRVWDPETGGPRPVAVRGHGSDAVVHDIFAVAPTVADLMESADPAAAVRAADNPRWRLGELLEHGSRPEDDLSVPRLLSPVDLQVIKACGVTFVDSMVERVIEERCAGDASRAAEVRAAVEASLSGFEGGIGSVEPGSHESARIKEVLLEQGLWSQYLEVGLGPDPEVFTKGPVLSSVGYGTRIGIPAFSSWNNPEPELVLVVDSAGTPRGATLGNDVNLRDVEGRSALLLGMAKDNNASTALGPFVRLFDEHLRLDDLRDERIALRVEGRDGYQLDGENNVGRLSRSFERLIAAASGDHHQYPDGFVLFTGTLFAPTQDRDTPGLGFTHKPGDRVSISSPHLGTLTNEVGAAEQLPPWTFGVRALTRYLLQTAGQQDVARDTTETGSRA
ncbi:fumarylacetoacetate hydrolase family protein [Georgenia deserti]|uniref:Fumarylacetoacetate hydrolase family protein n=1 Tax=Georgenia deserti TaxID=2093781 RepID=A0ABW4L2F9_9MICO